MITRRKFLQGAAATATAITGVSAAVSSEPKATLPTAVTPDDGAVTLKPYFDGMMQEGVFYNEVHNEMRVRGAIRMASGKEFEAIATLDPAQYGDDPVKYIEDRIRYPMSVLLDAEAQNDGSRVVRMPALPYEYTLDAYVQRFA